MGKEKEFKIEIPIQGKKHVFKTDLICNSCGKKIEPGNYLYFCVNDEDDLCSNYECLKKHAGHQFFRWGKVQLESDPKTPTVTSSLSTLVPTRPPAVIAPGAPAEAPPPTETPLVNTATLSLRTSLLSELKRLKCISEKTR
ncbi:MAG: hypothetical protein HWN66_17450 [Candidatus Helarchaeota archaeon]|nr:hypothetical protein [Candidatus Helarchaeota archaeon]